MDRESLRKLWDAGACHNCRHLKAGTITCTAYPEGIPVQIASGETDHLVARPGDHGILFEPKPGAKAPEPPTPSQCLSCKWLGGGDLLVCKAFPSQIPDEIVANLFDHREPYHGDDGVRFEPEDGTPKPYLDQLYEALDRADPHDAS